MTPGTIDFPGGALEVVEIAGDRSLPSLVLMHGGLGSAQLWDDFTPKLAAATGSRTVAFSRHGHGWSARPPKPRTPRFMHEEAREVTPELLSRLELEDPILVGHSDGASIALIYAAHRPAQAVVAMAPHVFVEEVGLREIARARDAFLHGGLRERMARRHRDPDAAFYGWNDVWLDPAFADWDIRGLVSSIACPLLVIQGRDDQYGTMAQIDAIEAAARVPVTRVELDCRHAPQLERPRETLEAIAGFVGGLEVRR